MSGRARSGRRRFLMTLAMLATMTRDALGAPAIDVSVDLRGATVVVDVRARAAAVTPAVAWSVLTDYDHMATFLSAIRSSRIVTRTGNRLEVAQAGAASLGPLTFAFSTLRAVELSGDDLEIRSHLIRGDFRSYDFSTRVVPDAGGGATLLHHGEYVPDRWVPPLIGPALIAGEVRRQYEEFIAEMQRRQAASAPAAVPRHSNPLPDERHPP